jgi:hypothetical protein
VILNSNPIKIERKWNGREFSPEINLPQDFNFFIIKVNSTNSFKVFENVIVKTTLSTYYLKFNLYFFEFI